MTVFRPVLRGGDSNGVLVNWLSIQFVLCWCSVTVPEYLIKCSICSYEEQGLSVGVGSTVLGVVGHDLAVAVL